MEISKQEFAKWFKSENVQIASFAMRNQWLDLLEGKTPFFSEDELWKTDADLASKGLRLALLAKPKLVPIAIQMLRKNLSEGKYLPFGVWLYLMHLAVYDLKRLDNGKILLKDLIAEQSFSGAELLDMIGSVLRSVDQMPEFLDCGKKWIEQAVSDVNFCIVIQKFLKEWGRLDECSNELILLAFSKLLPEWAPLMIEALNNVSGPYRYDLSLSLFKIYFKEQPLQVTKAVVACFKEDTGDEELKQKLIDGVFNFLNAKEQPVEMETALAFVEGIKHFLIDHWADNCAKFSNFWDKMQNVAEIFTLIRSAFKNDWAFAAFRKCSLDPWARLKTPLHMLCYLPVAESTDWCILLLKVLVVGSNETKNIAAQIFTEKEDFLRCSGKFDDYAKELQEIIIRSAEIPEVKIFAGSVVNALVKYGPAIEKIEDCEEFVKRNALSVPALGECYEQEIMKLQQQKIYEADVLKFLRKFN